ncbi:MAG: SpoIVB peptidase [Bacillota bacterium]|nr:SpoIVB peptidase [Bacillota bacterium]
MAKGATAEDRRGAKEHCMAKERRVLEKSFILFALFVFTLAGFAVRPLAELPDELDLVAGQPHDLRLPPGVWGYLDSPGQVRGTASHPQSMAAWLTGGSRLTLDPRGEGKARLEFRLLGVLPVRSVLVSIMPDTRVMVGGQSIGVVVSSRGVVVTGLRPVRTVAGLRSPAQEAGILPGDIILSAGGLPVRDEADLVRCVERAGESGQPLELEVERDDRHFKVSVTPVGLPDGTYRIGLAVRDGTAGVGTLTMWDPITMRFAALGHLVTDTETGRPVRLEEGHIVLAGIVAVHEGRRGQPGEKVGVFLPELDVLGRIERNTGCGIVGTLTRSLSNSLYPGPVPLAAAATVREGPAQVLTVVDDQTIESFQAQIQKVWVDRRYEGKGMVVRITDPRLRQLTGGIVQGMSGSPVIQDGRLVGAVTHVFVNDPARGYGVLAQWMWEEMAGTAAVRAP